MGKYGSTETFFSATVQFEVWHMHECRQGRVAPATRAEFWRAKRQGNVGRDSLTEAQLIALGWSVCTIWECELKNSQSVAKRLENFLNRLPDSGGRDRQERQLLRAGARDGRRQR